MAGIDLRAFDAPDEVREFERGRFELWLRNVVADARGGDPAAVSGDVATLEWIRDRIVLGLDKVEVTRIDTLLRDLRSNAAEGELGAASETAVALRRVVDKLG